MHAKHTWPVAVVVMATTTIVGLAAAAAPARRVTPVAPS
jgi:hypothetical protein